MKTLKYLLYAYFHQDWDAEHETENKVVLAFRQNEPPEVISALKEEISSLLTGDDSEIKSTLEKNDITVPYEVAHTSPKDWLNWLNTIIKSSD